MTYFSTMSKNNGKSALQGGSNTNTTTGPEMIDIQKKYATFVKVIFLQAYNNMVLW
jgi:hypothetical protein